LKKFNKIKKLKSKILDSIDKTCIISASLVLAIAIVYNSIFVYGRKKDKSRYKTK